jgi:segregation and condensation protein B
VDELIKIGPEPAAEDAPVPAANGPADVGGDALADGELSEASEEVGTTEEKSEESAAGAKVATDGRLIEALLLSSHHPLTGSRLVELSGATGAAVRAAIKNLNAQYASTGRAFRIEQVAGGYQILTLAEFGDALKKLHQKESDARLTKAALETLAVIAYKQPIVRAEVEAIRGVACGETIRSLMEKHLVNIAGRAEEPGRPILYGTTRRFLELFGLNSIKDLPQPEVAPK